MTQTKKFADALRNGSRNASARGCYGRIVRSKDGQPQSLTEDTDRRVVMVMGPLGLRTLLGKSGFEMVCQIGYTGDYIERKLEEGFKFHLALFARPDGELKVATWKNTLAVVAEAYPEVADIVLAQAWALKKTSFEEFESQAGFSFADVDALGSDDERFMTVQRLLASDRSPLAVRRFLYHSTRLSELYTGTGSTKTRDGDHGVREYIMRNRSVSQLGEFALLELQINVPAAG